MLPGRTETLVVPHFRPAPRRIAREQKKGPSGLGLRCEMLRLRRIFVGRLG